MSRWVRAARIGAISGAGVGGLAGAAYGLLVGEAKLARRTVGPVRHAAPFADGVYGRGRGAPLRLALLGDSAAAGVGVTAPEETPGAVLATQLAAELDRPVRLRVAAVSGSKSSDLEPQVLAVLEDPPDVAVISIGANDVTHKVSLEQAVIYLAAAVRRLGDAGVAVVVATCPDLGTVKPVLQPLRTVARRRSRQMARRQTVAVVESGGTSVSIGELLGREFDKDPALFSEDRFHPSAQGYTRLADVLVEPILHALGKPAPAPAVEERDVIEPVRVAAAEAVAVPGTEVAGAEVRGRERGPRGRWARLRRRGRDESETPADEAGLGDPGVGDPDLGDSGLADTGDTTRDAAAEPAR